jgi:hypothetical protein
MKKWLPILLCLASACSKEDATPSYASFTPISGQFAVFVKGRFRYTGHDTTSVLSDLQLRIQPGATATADMYEFRGNLDKHQTITIQFYAPQSRAGSGPWTKLEVNLFTSMYRNSVTTSNSSTAGTLSASGDKFTGSFDILGDIKGTLK